MMLQRVETHKNFLRALHTLKPKYRALLLKKCTVDEINCICECIHNVLQGKIQLDEDKKKHLQKFKSVLRKLIQKGRDKHFRKKILIQKGGAFLPIIIGAILSTLFSKII